MQGITSSIYAAGGFIMLVGIIGTFYRLSNDAGALAIAGAVLVTGAMISNAIAGQNKG